MLIAFEKSVGAVVFRKEDDKIYYLLLNYGELKNGNYHWSFAKGHVEEGEIEEETMRREVSEETGINDLKIIGGFRESNRYFYHARGKERQERKQSGRKTFIIKSVIYFLAETKTKEIKISEEHIGFVWLAYKEAMEKITFKNSKKILENANRFLAEN
jgi:bis(5'-nucleosidyl)-tetraphosphatase